MITCIYIFNNNMSVRLIDDPPYLSKTNWCRGQDQIPSGNNVKNMVCVRYPQKQILLHEPSMGSALQFFSLRKTAPKTAKVM